MTPVQSALIVAHGSPADPAPQEAAMQALAARVGAALPGWQVQGATLAAPGALEAALARAVVPPLIYPFFMAQGWFTGRELPRRLALAGAADLRQLDPFGVDPAMPALVARVAAAGVDPARTTLLLAAHGSKVSRTSANAAHALADQLRAQAGFARVVVGFIEEAPFLADAARDLGPAVCLPFFALRAGHVEGDVPEALDQAGFTGALLPEIGAYPEAAGLIAAALRREP